MMTVSDQPLSVKRMKRHEKRIIIFMGLVLLAISACASPPSQPVATTSKAPPAEVTKQKTWVPGYWNQQGVWVPGKWQ
jgi:hypothetical protein